MFVVNKKRQAVLWVLSVVWVFGCLYVVVGVVARGFFFAAALLTGEDWSYSESLQFSNPFLDSVWPLWPFVAVVVAVVLTFPVTIRKSVDDDFKAELLLGIKKQIRKIDSLTSEHGYVLWVAKDEQWPARFKLVADGDEAFTVTKITEGKEGDSHEEAYLTFSYNKHSLTLSRGCSVKEMYKLRDMLRDARKYGEQGPPSAEMSNHCPAPCCNPAKV